MATESEELNGQVAVVTGAARGIGRAIALKLGAMGAKVFVSARNQGDLEAVAGAIREAGGVAAVAPCDLLKERAIAELAAAVKAEGRCQIVVNCAGVGYFGKPLWEMPVEQFDTTLAVNLRAPFLVVRAFAPMMIEGGGGHIVNISSLAGHNPVPNGTAYSASKWGLNGLTYSLAQELREHKIRVSVIAPGSVNTGFGGGDAGADERAQRKIQPADVAHAVAAIVTQAPQSFISEILLRPTTKP